MFRLMDFDFNQRGSRLPEGCKDLVEVLQPKTAITGRGFEIAVQLSVPKCSDIQIIGDRNTLRIVTRQGGSRTIEVPGAYSLAGARATYFNDWLRILVPKAGSDPVPETN
jgi:hypothetical protein